MPTSRGPCPICSVEMFKGNSNLEDVLPQWVRETVIAQLPRLRHGSQEAPRTKLRICLACHGLLNQRWESRAARFFDPIIEARPLTLGRDDQRFFAEWVFKTDVLSELYRPAPKPGDGRAVMRRWYTAALRQAMAGKGLPASVTVRAALYGRQDPGGFAAVPHSPVVIQGGLNATASVFHESVMWWQAADALRFVQDHNDDPRLSVMQPYLGPIEWPPQASLSVHDHENAQRAWGHTDQLRGLVRSAGNGTLETPYPFRRRVAEGQRGSAA